jgi:tetratricopeptide (TPR) repeat protein
VEISLDFARLLLEADQHARDDRFDEARGVYDRIAELSDLEAVELALIESRVARLDSAAAPEEESLRVVERTPESTPPTEEARAEALANDGDIEGAVAIYKELAAAEPENDLVAERLNELSATAPVVEQATEAVQAAVTEMVVGGADWREALPNDPVEMLQLLLERVRANRRPSA